MNLKNYIETGIAVFHSLTPVPDKKAPIGIELPASGPRPKLLSSLAVTVLLNLLLNNRAWTEFLLQSSEDAGHRDW